MAEAPVYIGIPAGIVPVHPVVEEHERCFADESIEDRVALRDEPGGAAEDEVGSSDRFVRTQVVFEQIGRGGDIIVEKEDDLALGLLDERVARGCRASVRELDQPGEGA